MSKSNKEQVIDVNSIPVMDRFEKDMNEEEFMQFAKDLS